jgi:hypothetical protein
MSEQLGVDWQLEACGVQRHRCGNRRFVLPLRHSVVITGGGDAVEVQRLPHNLGPGQTTNRWSICIIYREIDLQIIEPDPKC